VEGRSFYKSNFFSKSSISFLTSLFPPAIVTCLHEVGHRKEALLEKLFSEHPFKPKIAQYAYTEVESPGLHAVSGSYHLEVKCFQEALMASARYPHADNTGNNQRHN
jgi:hypothetical protein